MDNPPSDKKKISIEAALYRLRFMFVMIMALPLFGMIAAIFLLYRLNVNNLNLLVGAIMLMMIIYVSTTYIVARRIMRLGKRSNSDSSKPKENSH